MEHDFRPSDLQAVTLQSIDWILYAAIIFVLTVGGAAIAFFRNVA